MASLQGDGQDGNASVVLLVGVFSMKKPKGTPITVESRRRQNEVDNQTEEILASIKANKPVNRRMRRLLRGLKK